MVIPNRWSFANAVMPHGFCYQWNPSLIWLHAISDTLIALAYFLIPVILIYFARRRRDIPLNSMLVCFGGFIAACGATHAMEVWTLWVPSYWLSGGIKVITVMASVPTAIFLVRSIPTVLSLPSPDEMRSTIEQLKQQKAVLKISEERFRQIAENIQEIFWTMDPETKGATYVSPAFEQICELSLNSIRTSPTCYVEMLHPADRSCVLAGIENLPITNRFDEEFRIVCPGGRIKWLRAIGSVARDSNGIVTTLLGTAQEITARKELEIQIREKEDRYRDLVENSTDLICTYNLQGQLLSLNELPATLLGYSREELLSMPLRNIVVPEGRTQFDESLLRIQRDGFVKGTMVVVTKTGERRTWEYHNTLRTEGVAVPIVRGMAHDITDRKRLEKALRLSEEKFAKAFHSSPVEITISTFQEDRFLDANEAFERNTGFIRDEILGHTSIELDMWDDPAERAHVIEDLEKLGRLRNREVHFRTKAGKSRVVLYSAEQIQVGGKQCVLAVGQDITRRKEIEQALQISEEKFSKCFRASPSIVSIYSLNTGRFLDVNESFERQTGFTRDELAGRSALDSELCVNPSEMESILCEVRNRGYVRDQEVKFRDKTGEVAIIQISAELLELQGEKCLLTVGQDVTERKKAAEDLRKLSGQLLRSQDDERRRIAQDLHDSTGQNLVALATMIGQLGRPSRLDQRRKRRLLLEAKALADQCIREVRTLSYSLYPAVLDGIGLAGAIGDYVNGFCKRSGIQVNLKLPSNLGHLERGIELALLRVVQEALTNIQRHSGSQKATIRIERDAMLALEISDCGCGIVATQKKKIGTRLEFGVGISSMQERIRLIGGSLSIDSSDQGTKLLVTVPL